MSCIATACGGCPEWIITLAYVGGIVLYAILGILLFFIIKSFKEDIDWELIIFFIILWPLIIAGGIAFAVIYYIGGYIFKFFTHCIVGADKHDLKLLEDKITNKIDTKITKEDNKIMNYLEYDYVPPKPMRKKPAKDKKSKVSKKGKK